MKRHISIILAVLLLITCMFTATPKAYASGKTTEPRAIAIVFDNSGSMYIDGDKAWCRATYAMEVFASMLNDGDILQIYPMSPIEIDGKEYTMDNPYQLTSAAKASTIRNVYTDEAGETPIESIDCAADGLKKLQANKKYLIVLTDGGQFSKGDHELDKLATRDELDKLVEQYAGKDMKVMYLGVGSAACIPQTEESEYFVKRHATNTADVLSSLTEMCNLVFGRDTLPKKWVNGNNIEFDISMSKLIVFVQGENIADLQLKGASIGQPVSVQQTQYSTLGAGNYRSIPDTSLQGMMVTYADCAPGTYSIEYTGTATSVEIYYEPDADLDFIFTDAAGNTVEKNTLYEGSYKVSYGIKDAKTGEMISSELLGNPSYVGSYTIDGDSKPIKHEGFSGSVDIPLKKGEKFNANITVTYLSGYTITKDASDFGWSEDGIVVAAKPAGELTLVISGGADIYSLQDLTEGEPYIAEVYYEGTKLTGGELEKVDLKWISETSNAEIKREFANDHWNLYLDYKDPAAPQNTVCGECTVSIDANYVAPGCGEALAIDTLTYNIKDESSLLQVELFVPETYIVIGELKNSKPIVASLKLNGAPMSARDFAAVSLLVDCDGIEYDLIPNEQDSSYSIKLLPTKGIDSGEHTIKIKAQYADHIGRETQVEDEVKVTLSNIPLWMRWLLVLLALVLLGILIWIITHIKVLPKYAHTTRKLSSMNFDGDDVTQATNFQADIKKKSAKVQARYGGRAFGISMDVKPGKESFLYKAQKRKNAVVTVASVKKFGPAKIQEAMIGSAKFVADETTGKLVPALPNQRPFALTNGMMIKYSGTIQDAGVDKDFEVTSKLNFKKK